MVAEAVWPMVEVWVRLEAAVVVVVAVVLEMEFISAPSLSELSSELDPERDLEDPSAESICFASFDRRDWRKSWAGRGREGGNNRLFLEGHLPRSFH